MRRTGRRLHAGLLGLSVVLTGVTGWAAIRGIDSPLTGVAHLLAVAGAVGVGVAAWRSLRTDPEERPVDPVTITPAFAAGTTLAALADLTDGPVLGLIVAGATLGLAGATTVLVAGRL